MLDFFIVKVGKTTENAIEILQWLYLLKENFCVISIQKIACIFLNFLSVLIIFILTELKTF